ncbi:hypothetical protein [Methanopyrus kandleri]|nr:hypothetical protein [Methanopyrus kandleri]HII71046.1 hypothetical protein [Methanopyrus kandleri]
MILSKLNIGDTIRIVPTENKVLINAKSETTTETYEFKRNDKIALTASEGLYEVSIEIGFDLKINKIKSEHFIIEEIVNKGLGTNVPLASISSKHLKYKVLVDNIKLPEGDKVTTKTLAFKFSNNDTIDIEVRNNKLLVNGKVLMKVTGDVPGDIVVNIRVVDTFIHGKIKLWCYYDGCLKTRNIETFGSVVVISDDGDWTIINLEDRILLYDSDNGIFEIKLENEYINVRRWDVIKRKWGSVRKVRVNDFDFEDIVPNKYRLAIVGMMEIQLPGNNKKILYSILKDLASIKCEVTENGCSVVAESDGTPPLKLGDIENPIKGIEANIDEEGRIIVSASDKPVYKPLYTGMETVTLRVSPIPVEVKVNGENVPIIGLPVISDLSGTLQVAITKDTILAGFIDGEGAFRWLGVYKE